MRKRNVISHVILLFSRDFHMIALTLSPQLDESVLWRLLIMYFSCCDIFLRPSERRNVFSSSREFGLPPLKQVVADASRKADKLPDVFLLG